MNTKSNYQQMSNEVDFKGLLNILKENRKFIIFFTLFSVIFAFVYLSFQTKIYKIKADINIGNISNFTLEQEKSKKYMIEPQRLKYMIVNSFDNSHNKKRFPIIEAKLDKESKDILHLTIKNISNNKAKENLKSILEWIKKQEGKKLNEYTQTIRSQIAILQEQLQSNKKILTLLNSQISSAKDSFEMQTLLANIKSLSSDRLEIKLKIDRLKSLISSVNISRTSVIGKIKLSDTPIKPKRAIFTLLSGTIGFLLALFWVLLRREG